MILLETNTKSTSSSSLGVVTSKDDNSSDKSGLSFSELLKGAKDSKSDKSTQKGAIVLAFDPKESNSKDNSKKDSLLSLLKNDKSSTKDEKLTVDLKEVKEVKELVELNPKATQDLSAKELKTLVADAKQYLKNQILNSDGYKKSELKDLPKTLKGLAQMAKKFDVDVSKITLEEVKAVDSSKTTKETLATDIKIPHAKTQESAKVNENISKVVQEKDLQENVKFQDKQAEVVKEVKSTPLFKAQEKSEHTTEQIVQTKQFKVEEKTPKEKADETLKLLLRGEKPSQTSAGLTSDFSVATAKVIAPSATTDATKSLEQLLHGDKKESTSSQQTKLDGINTHKADSFEVKVNEAKQMIKYISQDVKTAIEDYKSPFTRIKVQLNPEKLGAVDLTVVQRGNNLHVNISSNNVAINALAMNANDLRAQLSNNGINNASLNFNNTPQGQDGSAQQQQNQQQQAREEYQYAQKEEINEEIISSLEIIVPHYA